MVQGYPLQYYSYNPYSILHSTNQKYDYYKMTEISEEMLISNSPHSIQSDSDNSISSTDVIRKPIAKDIKKKSDVKCGWQNCDCWFETLDQLATHVSRTHANSGPAGLFYCGWEGCSRNNKGFNARYKMLVHVRTHTNEKPHQCCQCDKSFSRAENLKIHSRSHSGEKPYVCPVTGCNKAYSNSSDRFKHTRTHQVEKPYRCKVPGCPKRYTDPSSLRKHVKTYKHCVTQKTDSPNVQTNISEPEKIDITNHFNPLPTIKNVNNKESCSCPHTCCLKTCISNAAELLKLGALINLSNHNLDAVHWNTLLLNPLMYPNHMYNDFKDKQMDCDGPLDLTVHRK